MRHIVYLIIFLTSWIMLGCQAPKMYESAANGTGKATQEFILTIRVMETGRSMNHGFLSQLTGIIGPGYVSGVDWSGMFGGPVEISVKLQAVSEHLVRMICSDIYRLQGVLFVGIDKK